MGKKRILLKENIYMYMKKNLSEETLIMTKARVAYFTLGKYLLLWQDYKN